MYDCRGGKAQTSILLLLVLFRKHISTNDYFGDSLLAVLYRTPLYFKNFKPLLPIPSFTSPLSGYGLFRWVVEVGLRTK